MSEWNALYLVKDKYIIDNFKEIYINSESVGGLVDRVVITLVGGKYGVKGYKDNVEVGLLPDRLLAYNVEYCRGYFEPETESIIYRIEYEDNLDTIDLNCERRTALLARKLERAIKSISELDEDTKYSILDMLDKRSPGALIGLYHLLDRYMEDFS
jgi:hypothetical protein